MEISSAIFLYSFAGLFLAILYLIISNIRQNRYINKTLREIRKIKTELIKVSEYNRNLMQYINTDDPAWLDVKLSDEKINKRKKRKKTQKKNKTNIKKKLSSILTSIIQISTGSKLLDILGIISFLIGIVFFVNYSIESEWTNVFGRLFFGLLLSGILLILGYLMFKKYERFSAILLSGGVATLIFTLFAAFYQYHIINKWLSFLILIILINSVVLISLLIKRQILAILTFLSGFIAPLTINIAAADYITLFIYLTVLNIGVIIYDYYKKSLLINLTSYVFTFLTYAVWLITQFLKRDDIPVLPAFIFLTIFYIMIFIILIINNIRENRRFLPIEFTGMMVATGLYYSVGVILINKTQMEYYGIFTAFIAIIQYTYFLILYRRKNYDKRILNLFLSLTIMFTALIVPVEYFGKSVTLVWAIQAGALLYIAIRSDLKPMYGGSINLTLGAIITLFYNLYDQYISTTTLANFKPFMNEGFFVSLITIAGLTTLILLIRKSPYEYVYFKFLKKNIYQAVLGIIALITFYLTIKFELQYYIMQYTDNQDIVKTYMAIFNFSFLILPGISSIFIRKKAVQIASFTAISIMFMLYIFYYSAIFANLRNSYLLSVEVSKIDFLVHYYAIALLIIGSIILIYNTYIIDKQGVKHSGWLTAIASFFILWLTSAETTNIVVVKKFLPYLLIQDIINYSRMFNYSLIWSILSMILISTSVIIGHKKLLFPAILLFFITFVKIFLYDFKYLTNQDLTILFTIMGVVMLLSSFLIQFKNKKLTNTII